jgi:hypothetical protein
MVLHFLLFFKELIYLGKNKSEDIKYIESCIGLIKTNSDIDENISRIERALSRTFNTNVEVSITDNNNDFFGVNVFPCNSTIEDLCMKMASTLKKRLDDELDNTDILVKTWQTSPSWRVEIDSKIIHNMSENYPNNEIVAAIIYEMIRVIYTPSVPLSLYNAFRLEADEMDHITRNIVTDDKINKLLHLAVFECCSTKLFKGDHHSTIYDIMSSMCISDDYDRLINTFITNGKSEYVFRTQKEVNTGIRGIILWVIGIVRELKYSKKKLRDIIDSEKAVARSKAVKAKLNELYSLFFEGVSDSYRVLLSEQWQDTPHDEYASIMAFENAVKGVEYAIKEAVNNSVDKIYDKHGKIKKISQLDIDVLVVDSGRIETHDDKIYLLDRIYDKMRIVDTALDIIEKGDNNKKVLQTKTTLLDYKRQLEDVRKVVLSTRIIEKQYGVFIRYPKGYEG